VGARTPTAALLAPRPGLPPRRSARPAGLRRGPLRGGRPATATRSRCWRCTRS